MYSSLGSGVQLRLMWIGGAALVLLTLGGCEVGDNHDGPSAKSVNSEREVTLLTWSEGASMEALIRGRLRITSSRCFALDDHILVAPPDSRVDPDSSGIEIPGLGHVAVGDEIESSGGFLPNSEIPSDIDVGPCLEGDVNGEAVFLTP